LDKNVIAEKIVEIIKSHSEEDMQQENVLELSFEDGIVNSLEFVSIVIELETEFDIEFDDDMLLISSYENIGQLVDYISKKVES
jgi:acyl carrier protein